MSKAPGDKDNRSNGQRILVVDDGLVSRKLLERKLLQSGFEVLCASDGAQALEQALAIRPSAVITDLHMPRVNGFELCRAIRQAPQLSSIVVIITSAQDVTEIDRQQALAAGANKFLTRTADFSELISTLLEALEANRTGH